MNNCVLVFWCMFFIRYWIRYIIFPMKMYERIIVYIIIIKPYRLTTNSISILVTHITK